METNKYVIASEVSYVITATSDEEAEQIANAYNALLGSVLKSSPITFINNPIEIKSIGAVIFKKDE
jgi:hypothetical protein